MISRQNFILLYSKNLLEKSIKQPPKLKTFNKNQYNLKCSSNIFESNKNWLFLKLKTYKEAL